MSRRRVTRKWLTSGLCLAVGGLVVAQYAAPSNRDRTAAVGSVEGLDPAMRRSFTDDGEFEAKKAPRPGDWLAQHREAGQTYAEYLRSKPNRPDGRRRLLYILPIGEFAEGKAPSLATLREYTAAYYAPLRVWILPAIEAGKVQARSRVNGQTGKKQWHSEDLLGWMQGQLPDDAYAMIAVTMTDLYPKDSWNFVFGQASLRHRVGVFSFARYDPRFWDDRIEEGSEALVLNRAAKVLTHEMGHMFGMAHCVHYECNMNGSNNLLETDASPVHLCPVCLRKIQHVIGFDPAGRYQRLGGFYKTHAMEKEAAWVGARLRAIEAAK